MMIIIICNKVLVVCSKTSVFIVHHLSITMLKMYYGYVWFGDRSIFSTILVFAEGKGECERIEDS